MKRKFLSTLCLILLACVFSTAQAGVKIVVLGSSTAAGAGVGDSNNAWVNRYRTYLQSIDPTTQVINLAKGGYTTCAIMPTGTPDYPAGSNMLKVDTERNIDKALSYAPGGIIINMPTNDVSNGIPVATQMEHFATIIKKAEDAGVKVWITTSQPHNFGEKYAGPYSESKQPDYYKQQARNQFKELTAKILEVYGDRAINFYEGIATDDGYSFIKPDYDSGDGVHLNDAAHAVLFEKVKTKNIPSLLGDSSSDGVLVSPVYINFGPTPSGSDSWNDVNSQNSGTRLDVLKDASGVFTSLSLNVLTGFTNAADNGSSSTIMDMNVAISKSNFSSNGVNPVIELSGLSPKQVYDFYVFASRAGDGNRESVYDFAGANTKSATLDAASNSQNLAEVKAVRPDATGKITLTISKSTNNTAGYCYINAMKITSAVPEVEIPEGAINVATPGTLSSLLAEPLSEISSLVLYGSLNGTDIKTIMSLTALKDLDMQNARIVSGGEAYLNGMKTRDNVFPQEMFANNKVIESVILPAQITDLLYHTFMGCSSLKKIVIPESVKNFGNDLFSGCSVLSDLTMPKEMKAINSGCFYNCKQLTSITIPDGITAINGSVFYGCSALETIVLPKTIETIGLWSFAGCNALKEIKFGKAIKSIESGAFYNCWSLNMITCKATTLPAITGTNGTTPFTGAFKPQSCTLKIPFTAYSLYKDDTACWGAMSTITPLETITADGSVLEPSDADILLTASVVSIAGSMPDATGLNSLLVNNKQVTSIDLTGVTEHLDILTTGNPNCLLYTPAGSDLIGENVIVGNKAKNIVLADKMPFAAPVSFTAETVTYTRDLGAEGIPSGKNEAKGWATIALPFTVTNVAAVNKSNETVSLASYDENGNVETGKAPYWLRKITSEGFVNTSLLEANTPYIICFPNHADYEDRYNIIGEVTFSAQDCLISQTPSFVPQQGNEYDITCTLQGQAQSETIYAINAEGSAFDKNSRNILPFECFVTAKDGAKAPARFLIQGGATSLESVSSSSETGCKVYAEMGEIMIETNVACELPVYDISGKLIRTEKVSGGKHLIANLAPGVYIIANQKAVKQ